MNKNLPLCLLFFICSFTLFFSSSSWFSMWVSMELNTMMFICLLFNNNKQKMESVLNYFIIQSVSSLFLLYSFMGSELWAMNITSPSLLMIMALCLKVGSAPFHSWLIPMAFMISSKTLLWMVLTIQKVIPLILLTLNTSKSNLVLMLFIALCVLLGSSMNMMQASMKMMIILSSLSNMGWLLISSLKTMNMENYLTIYTIMVGMIMSFMPSKMNSQMTKKQMTTVMLSMAMLGGVPPLMSFLLKLMISISLVEKEMFLMLMLMLSMSTLDMYVYSRMSFLSAMSTKTSLFWESLSKNKMWVFLLLNTIPLVMVWL